MARIKQTIKFWQLLLLLFVSTNAFAQTTTYSFSPAIDVWTDASRSGNVQPRFLINCSLIRNSPNPNTYYGDIIKWRIRSISGSTALVEIRKIDGSAFLNNASTKVRPEVCNEPREAGLGGTTITAGSRVAYFPVTLPASFTSGNMELKIVLESIDNSPNGLTTLAWGGVITITANTTTPPPPCGIPSSTSESNVQETQATLHWLNSTNVNGRHRPQGTTMWTNFTTSGSNKTILSLTGNTTYEWQVQGICPNGNSSWSNIDTFRTSPPPPPPPPAPCGTPLSTFESNIQEYEATLNWTFGANNNDGNVRYRIQGTSIWINVTASGTSKRISSLSANTMYEWQIKAGCTGGESDWSAIDTFRTSTPPPPPAICGTPSTTSESNVQQNQATLGWANGTNNNTVNGRYRPQGTTTWTDFTISGTSKTILSLTANTTYEWQVQGVCPNGNSSWSNIDTFRTLQVQQPQINVNPSSLNFRNVTIGASASETITISNQGNAPLMITNILVNNRDFSLSTINSNVAVGGSQILTVTYSPSSSGAIIDEILIYSNDPATPIKRISLTGVGENPQSSNCLIIPFPARQVFTPTQRPGGGTSHNPNTIPHYAWDFAAPIGTPFVAVVSGEIVIVVNNFPNNNCNSIACANNVNRIVLRGNDGFDYLYLHNNPNSARVTVGQRVNQGDILGEVGNSGYSTGSHLHFQKQNSSNSYYTQSLPIDFGVSMTLWNQYAASGICGVINPAGTGGVISTLLIKADAVSVAFGTVGRFSVRATGIDVALMAGVQGEARLPLGAVNVRVVDVNPSIRNFRDRIIDNADGTKTVRFLLSNPDAFNFTPETALFDVEFELDNNFTNECAAIDVIESSLRAANDNTSGSNSMEVSSLDGEICKISNVTIDFLVKRNDGATINNVSILDVNDLEIAVTNTNGEAQTEIPSGSTLVTTFSKPQLDEYWGVIEVGDLVRIENLIFNQQGSPIEFLIGDLDNNQEVSVQDMNILQNAIFDDITEYPGKRDWNFVKLLSSNPNEYPDYTDEVNLQNVQSNTLIDDYEAYVTGDFNFDASNMRIESLALNRKIEVDAEGNYIIKYILEEPAIINGYQMRIDGIENVLSVNSAVSDMKQRKMYKEKANSLRLMSYSALEEISLEAGTILLEIKAKNIKDLKDVEFNYVSSASGLALAPVSVSKEEIEIEKPFIYPNPIADKAFNFNAPEDGSIIIFDMLSNLILETKVQKGVNKITLNQKVAKGPYIVNYNSESNEYSGISIKIVIE